MDRTERIGGIAGIGFVIAFIVGIALQGDVPTYKDGGERIASWFADNGDRYVIGDLIIGLGIVLGMVPFLACMVARFSAAEGEQPVWSRAFLIGGAVWIAVGGVFSVLQGSIALLGGDVSPDIARTLAATFWYSLGVQLGAGAIVLGAAAVLVLRTHAFPAWLGWLAAVAAVLSLVASGIPGQQDPDGIALALMAIPMVGLGLWIVASSVYLLRVQPATRPGTIGMTPAGSPG